MVSFGMCMNVLRLLICDDVRFRRCKFFVLELEIIFFRLRFVLERKSFFNRLFEKVLFLYIDFIL